MQWGSREDLHTSTESPAQGSWVAHIPFTIITLQQVYLKLCSLWVNIRRNQGGGEAGNSQPEKSSAPFESFLPLSSADKSEGAKAPKLHKHNTLKITPHN